MSTSNLAQLRHELKTPVNHIIGYSELLIEDAPERHVEAFVPVLRQIQSGGQRLLESIQSALPEQESCPQGLDLRSFNTALKHTAAEILEISSELIRELDYGHRQTLADMEAISWALRQLLEFASGDEQFQSASKRPASPLGISGFRKPNHPPAKQRQGTILIADDDLSNRDLLRRRLESEGHVVLEARNGGEVLPLLKKHHCDLVLLDVMMPELDGFETLLLLKAEPTVCELPVIMISALDDMRSVVRCIEMGADDYLSKPFNRVLLHARIGASLEKKWLRDGERRKTTELEETLRRLEQAQAQLSVQASQDALTGLANRRSVDSQLDVLMKKGVSFNVFYIDLNGFKAINDTYGHEVGDNLLKQVSDRLRLAFRSTDMVGRWGGDEFVAAVSSNNIDTRDQMIRISHQFRRPFEIPSPSSGKDVRMSAAVGVATWQPGESIAKVLQRADLDMYEQKVLKTTRVSL